MKNDFLDEILEKTIDEALQMYIKENENITDDENKEEVKFSDLHNAKMKKLFNEYKKKEKPKFTPYLLKGVAAIFLIMFIITIGLVGTVKAWREEFINFIFKYNTTYIGISFGDNTEEESGDILQNEGDSEELIVKETIYSNSNTYTIDNIQFLYVPDGFEYIKKDENNRVTYYSFWNYENDKKIKLKEETVNNIEKLIDIEEASSKKYTLKDKEVFKVQKDDRTHYIWYINTDLYSVCSDIEDEQENLKFIENIKILKKK